MFLLKRSTLISAFVIAVFLVPFLTLSQEICEGGGDVCLPDFVVTADTISTTTPFQTAISIQLTGTTTMSGPLVFATTTNPTSGTLGSIDTDTGIVLYTPNSGFSGADSFQYTAEDGPTVSSAATVTITVAEGPSNTATITVRNGARIIAGGSVELSQDASATTTLSTTSGDPHDILVNSVLNQLSVMDAATSSFAISDLQYFSSFNSFFLNCIEAPADPASPLCGSWLYVVNGTDPGIGMDSKALVSGDVVYVYYGASRRVLLDKTTAVVNESFTGTAQSYNPVTDAYSPVTGVNIGVKDSGSAEVASSTVNVSGQVTFTLATSGTYSVGIVEDFYFPSSAITITNVSVTPPGGGGGGGGPGPRPTFSVPKALAYLASQQGMGGSYANALLGDWVAIAYAVGGADVAKNKLKSYYASSTPLLSSVTDYERHAMALQALGINPYSGSTRDFIAPIIQAFDGTQIGDPNLVNDDVFAIFPLLRAGFTESEEFIQRIAAFIISEQLPNGSWENSVDFTSATIQALALVKSAPGSDVAIQKARDYIKPQQQSNGGFADEYATSWVMQAIAAMNEPSANWIQPSTFGPVDYLAYLQQGDGGVGLMGNNTDSRIWATSYAIPGVVGKTWYQLLMPFSKPVGYAPSPIPTPVPRATTTPTVLGTTTTAIAPSVQDVARVVEEVIRPVIAEEATTTIDEAATSSQLAASAGSGEGFSWLWLLLLLLILLILYGIYKSREKLRELLRNWRV